MFKSRILILLLLPLFMHAKVDNTPVKSVAFYKGSLTTAKEKAAAEGKLIFVDFVASWCMPCRWMDETTFTDPTLVDYVEDNYIAVKVDIDDFDGFAWKQQYNIKLLPSILVFNSKGKLLERYEESMAPSKMLAVLQKHDTPANKVITARPTAHNAPPKPKPETKPSPAVVTTPAPDVPITRPPLKPNTNTTKPEPIKPAPTVNTAANKPETKPVPGSEGDGLYRFKVTRQASSGFSVQVGAFGHYGNVLREVSKLQSRFNRPIIVHISTLRDRTIYKVLIGDFPDKNAAIEYRGHMKMMGVEGIIKDMSVMK